LSRLEPEEHFISWDVWEGRPYVRWEPDDRDAVRREYDSSYMTGLAGQVGGYLMMRHPMPGLGLGHVYAEIRPDEPVWTGPGYWHYHPTTRPPKDFVPMIPERRDSKGKIVPPKPLSSRHVHTFEAMKKSGHIDRDRGNGYDHRGINDEDVHFHRPAGKYVFCPGDDRAQRVDIHPLAVDLFADAEVVFFVIEGCPKSDAVLTAILKSGMRAAVFSVPSVTLWRAPELRRFAEAHLRSKLVVIVPDGDWRDNPRVVTQAMSCRTRLTSLRLQACIASPTLGKGVDDHLVAGGTLGDLAVIGRDFPDLYGVWRLMERLTPGREDRVRRNFIINVAVAVHAGEDGTIKKNVRPLARIMDLPESRVRRAVDGLLEAGAWTADRPTLTTRGKWKGRYYDPSEQWDGDTPTFTIRRSYEHKPPSQSPYRPTSETTSASPSKKGHTGMTQQDAWDELFDRATASLDGLSQEDWQRVFATFAAMSDEEREQFQRETDAWVDSYTAGASRRVPARA
jgi:hypothetical protein